MFSPRIGRHGGRKVIVMYNVLKCKPKLIYLLTHFLLFEIILKISDFNLKEASSFIFVDKIQSIYCSVLFQDVSETDNSIKYQV